MMPFLLISLAAIDRVPVGALVLDKKGQDQLLLLVQRQGYRIRGFPAQIAGSRSGQVRPRRCDPRVRPIAEAIGRTILLTAPRP